MKSTICFIFFVLFISTVLAQVPQTLSYQGLLTDATTGAPVSNASHQIQFNFYTNSTGTGTAVFSRGPLSVTTFQGLFTVILGNGQGTNNAALPNNLGSTQYYVETVADGNKLAPLVQLTAVPYAFMASALDANATIGGSQINSPITNAAVTIPATQVTGTITNGQLATGIDASKITAGSLPNGVLDADLVDLADGTLTGSKVDGTTLTTVNATNITNGTLAIANGGTAAITAPAARTNLGVAIGTDVQAFDADLTDLADGSLTGSKVGTGISASNITTGTITEPTISLTGTDATKLASGTTAQRPGSAVEGQVRYNSTEKVMEYYNGTNWFFVTPKVAFLKDVRPTGTEGGTFTAGAFQTRALNTLEGDNSVCSLSANQFTLQPGTYIIEAVAMVYLVNQHKAIIKNISNNTDAIIGSSMYASISYDVSNTLNIYGTITIGTTTVFELQHRCTIGRGANGLGVMTNYTGIPEVYAQVKITKLR